VRDHVKVGMVLNPSKMRKAALLLQALLHGAACGEELYHLQHHAKQTNFASCERLHLPVAGPIGNIRV
jgi:hypothetical protein